MEKKFLKHEVKRIVAFLSSLALVLAMFVALPGVKSWAEDYKYNACNSGTAAGVLMYDEGQSIGTSGSIPKNGTFWPAAGLNVPGIDSLATASVFAQGTLYTFNYNVTFRISGNNVIFTKAADAPKKEAAAEKKEEILPEPQEQIKKPVITEEMLANAAYHDHANNGNDAKFSFIVTTPVSEYSDGVEAWGCPECGYVEYSGPISAYDFFNDTTARKIKVAQAGQTIHIDARQWVSFSKEVIDAMRARQDDITIELVYNSNGQLSTLTIPRGTDFSEVPEDKYTGMDFLALKLNIAPVPKN